MMKLFLDTEFTQLDWTAKLISIAVVDENEELFYIELSDTYREEDCSSFVKENVLPYLKGGQFAKPEVEATARLSLWIEERGVPCIFATDAPDWDMRLIDPLLIDFWPKNLSKEIVLVDIDCDVANALYWDLKLTRHYSPHDALVNKRGYLNKE